MPEVVGDAALLINPDDYQELADAILRVISDRQLRQELIQKGKVRSSLYRNSNSHFKKKERKREGSGELVREL